MPLPTGLRALTHRDYRLFFSGQVVSQMGSWMQAVGQSWLVLQLTDSPLLVGLVGTLQFTPVLLFSLVGGAIVDRLPRRRLIMGTQMALMLLALTLAALDWAGVVSYWHVAGLATVLGLVNALDFPVRQSFVVDLVGKDDLISGIALNMAVFNGTRVVGPAIAGVLIAQYGTALAFLLNGLSFIPVIIALAQVRTQGLPRPKTKVPILDEVAAGVRYALQAPVITLMLGMLLAVSVFITNHQTLVPLLARNVLGLDSRGFGLLMSALGAGALLGALSLAAGSRGPLPLRAATVPAVGLCLTFALIAMVPSAWAAAVLLFMVGFLQNRFTGGCNTTLQHTAPDEMRGRVMSLYVFVFAGMTPLGALFSGAVAEAYGVRAVFGLGAGIALVGIGALLLRHRHAGS